MAQGIIGIDKGYLLVLSLSFPIPPRESTSRLRYRGICGEELMEKPGRPSHQYRWRRTYPYSLAWVETGSHPDWRARLQQTLGASALQGQSV